MNGVRRLNKQQILKPFALFMCTVIWGVSFVAQSAGMQHVGPFTFTFVRYVLAVMVLLPIFITRYLKLRKKENRLQKMTPDEGQVFASKHRLFPLKVGIINGLLMFAGVSLQQIALQSTSPGKAAFITTTYIIWVPLIGLLTKKQNSGSIWLAVLLAAAGLYFLCLHGEAKPAGADLLLLFCALAFAIQIILIARWAPQVENVGLNLISFSVCVVLSIVPMVLTEIVTWQAISGAWGTIVYAGVLSSALTQLMQVYGQQGTRPAVASLILSLESAMSVLAARMILKTALSLHETIGCILMFSGILLAQIPYKQTVDQPLTIKEREEEVCP